MTNRRNVPWAWPDELTKAGVLGINSRNLGLILELNARKLYPRVDNKLITKEICTEHGIPVPETYAVLRRHADVRRFEELMGERTDFVAKPASGAAGRGIVVISRRVGDVYRTPSGRLINWSELRYHLSTIITGLYSLGGQPDVAIVEQRIVTHPSLQSVVVGGTPDVRVVLYRAVPVLAMLRLPTEQSGGRANLHQGAVAVGINLIEGKTFGGVLRDRIITHHPDTGAPLAGLDIPDWPQLRDASMKLADELELGYVGIDFVIDANRGAVVLEANARPGLAIQVANRCGLLNRLRWLKGHELNGLSVQQRDELIKQLVAET